MKNQLSKKEIMLVAKTFYQYEPTLFENWRVKDIADYIYNLQYAGYNLILDKRYLDYANMLLPSGKIVNIDDIYCIRRDELIEMVKEL